MPTQLTYFFSGPSTRNLTSHSLPLAEGPQTIAEPSLEPERSKGTCREGAAMARTSDAWPCKLKASWKGACAMLGCVLLSVYDEALHSQACVLGDSLAEVIERGVIHHRHTEAHPHHLLSSQ